MSNLISNNADFLFLYEAVQCNPNGDIDQENKPRMDYDNDINLVSDVRVKRNIRDYLSKVQPVEGQLVFVDTEGGNKVSPEERMKPILKRVLEDKNALETVFIDSPTLKVKFEEIKKVCPDNDKILAILVGDLKKASLSDAEKKLRNTELSDLFIIYLVKQLFVDIRFFGSTFAVKGVNKTFTGPIQLNWGYSLHKVKMIESNSIVTIMNDDNSTIGKDHRLYYSLLAFMGTINKYTAKTTALTEGDIEIFRNAIWHGTSALPTRSKMTFPKLYVEIVYNEGFNNGHFGDLRRHIKYEAKAVQNAITDEKNIRQFDDFNLNLDKLIKLIKENKGEKNPIKDVIVFPAEYKKLFN